MYFLEAIKEKLSYSIIPKSTAFGRKERHKDKYWGSNTCTAINANTHAHTYTLCVSTEKIEMENKEQNSRLYNVQPQRLDRRDIMDVIVLHIRTTGLVHNCYCTYMRHQPIYGSR